MDRKEELLLIIASLKRKLQSTSNLLVIGSNDVLETKRLETINSLCMKLLVYTIELNNL